MLRDKFNLLVSIRRLCPWKNGGNNPKFGRNRRGGWALALILAASLPACVRPSPPADPSRTAAVFIPPPASQVKAQTPTSPSSLPASPSPPPPSATPVRFLNDPSLPRSRYHLSVDFDYNRHQLHVFQGLTYVNRSGVGLDELVLIVEPNRQPGVFTLRDLTWADGQAIEPYRLEGSLLHVPLPQPLLPWNSLVVNLDYRLDLPSRPGTLGFTGRQTNLGDWYPFAPLYDPARGWLAHEPPASGAGEYLTYDLADYTVEIQLLEPPPGLILAASAPAQVEGNWHRFQVQAARNFTWSASPEYVPLVDETGFVTVYGYVFPEHRTAGESAVRTTAEALQLFAELFGPLTQESLSVVEAEFPDGMEYSGLYFLDQAYFATFFGGAQNFLTTLSAHETAHQWWYGMVANDQAYEPWLDEALSTYSERLYFERYFPEHQDWWWEFRIGLYQPDGWVNSAIYDHAGFRPYVNAVYLRGAELLHEIRNRVGEEAFLSGLTTYLARNSYGQVSAADLWAALEAAGAGDLESTWKPFFSPAADLPQD